MQETKKVVFGGGCLIAIHARVLDWWLMVGLIPSAPLIRAGYGEGAPHETTSVDSSPYLFTRVTSDDMSTPDCVMDFWGDSRCQTSIVQTGSVKGVSFTASSTEQGPIATSRTHPAIAHKTCHSAVRSCNSLPSLRRMAGRKSFVVAGQLGNVTGHGAETNDGVPSPR